MKTSPQQKAISAFMSARKRHLTGIHRSFPKYWPGMSTAEYVDKYRHLNVGNFDKQTAEVLPIDLSAYLHPATVPSSGYDEVIEELV